VMISNSVAFHPKSTSYLTHTAVACSLPFSPKDHTRTSKAYSIWGGSGASPKGTIVTHSHINRVYLALQTIVPPRNRLSNTQPYYSHKHEVHRSFQRALRCPPPVATVAKGREGCQKPGGKCVRRREETFKCLHSAERVHIDGWLTTSHGSHASSRKQSVVLLEVPL
jgi:hypothetical protein